MTATVTAPVFGLGQGQQRDLDASGLTATTILEAGIYAASGAEASALLGYGVGPGLVFPYDWNSDGTPSYARVKLNDAGPDGKRYRSPLGRGNRLYAPARLFDPAWLADPLMVLYLTEGEKKTLRPLQAGLLCVGLSGVWSWRQKGLDGASVVIEDLDRIAWTGRDVRIVFDSDAAQNAKVREAEQALSAELARRGAIVRLIRLPAGPNNAKQGLDDFLEAHGDQAFLALPCVPTSSAALPAYLEPIAVFLAEPDPPVAMLFPELLPAGVLMLVHGEPRARKSLAAFELALSAATGTAPFGLTRFRPAAPVPVLYVQEDDARALTRPRLRRLVRGLQLGSWWSKAAEKNSAGIISSLAGPEAFRSRPGSRPCRRPERPQIPG